MTTDSDSEYRYVANLADFNVIIVIVIVIKIIVIKVYNSKKSNNSNIYSNNNNNNNNFISSILLIVVLHVYNGNKRATHTQYVPYYLKKCKSFNQKQM